MRLLGARLPVRIELAPAFEGSRDPAAGGELGEPRVNGLTRPQIVDRILAMNPSATEDFLARFELDALSLYLDHLVAASMPRGRTACRVRPEGCCGVSWSARRN